jgi:mannose-6-phosphate isomerase-like protein (cupin superfamily)
MNLKEIDQTNRYTFQRLEMKSSDSYNSDNKELTTLFLHHGSIKIDVRKNNSNLESIVLTQGQGIVITPGHTYTINAEDNVTMYKVSSKVDNKEIIEIVDDGTAKNEVPLSGYKLILQPKHVDKPWGFEKWIIWTKNHHVLKQIHMTAGNKSSLQFHRKKLETNYLEDGEAEVIGDFYLNPEEREDILQQNIQGVNFDDYKTTIRPGNHWTSHPGTVHRVISLKDYLAYEVSTPELDDVIRLKDDTGRSSGRIDSEHKKK